MKNIIERPIVPYNPSASKVVNKEQYSLFAPVASNGKVGMAAFNPAQFSITDQTVSIKDVILNSIFKKVDASKLSNFDINSEKDGNTLYYNCEATIDDVPWPGVLFVVEAKAVPSNAREITEFFISGLNIWSRRYVISPSGQISSTLPNFSLLINDTFNEKLNELDEKTNELDEFSVKKDANGNVVITGNLTVQGETTVVDTDTLQVDAPIAVVNTSYLDGETPEWTNGGIVILLDEENAFGLVYNRHHEKVIASLGKYKDGVFTANGTDFVPLWNGESRDGYIPMFQGGRLVPSTLSQDELSKHDEWDYILTSPFRGEDFYYTGNILVKGVRFSEYVDLFLGSNVRRLKFVDCWFSAGVAIRTSSGCTIEGVRIDGNNGYGSTLRGFRAVIDCKATGGTYSTLALVGCEHISDCEFETASYCNYIENCVVKAGEAHLIKIDHCNYICGVNVEESSTDEVLFDNCSYISNVNANGNYNITYKDCKYVDAQSCSQFVREEDVGKIQLLTDDGSFKTFDIVGEVSGMEEVLNMINEGGVE